jgi:hypothetical protein
MADGRQRTHRRWIPTPNIDAAVASWWLVLVSGNSVPVGWLCLDCARAHPDPATILLQ